MNIWANAVATTAQRAKTFKYKKKVKVRVDISAVLSMITRFELSFCK